MYKAIIVGANFQNNNLIDYYMEELQNLAEACDIEVLYSITQAIDKITPNLYIGSGKVKEIKGFATNLDADLVIFNNELSGSQIRNLEEAIGVRVIDRTLLILDIFASRAKTKEAMLQVEIAQLEYMLPRLAGLTPSLNRQQGGIGSKGPGEKKIELDRRKIENDRSKLKKELEEIVKARKVQRKNRTKSSIKRVAVVGYTNAGKSTLVNALIDFTNKDTDKKVYTENMLFATLETSTRHIILDNNKEFLITDTVGFVSNLPHNLVESFKSTLEEISEADLLLHVVDSNHEFYEKQIEITLSTLSEIGVHDIPMIYLYNKSDLLKKPIYPSHNPHLILSLKDEIDVALLLQKIENELYKEDYIVTLLVPFTEGDLVSYFNENAKIITQEYTNDGTLITVELNPILVSKYANYIIKMDQ
ncbi:MAG: GTPase HflX [Firmicutes bacterium]|nr:GTPase HflX [Bacillota bacterium]